MQIAVEGMDGVGKTTIAHYISEKYNFKFIEKPLQYFYNDGADKKYEDLMKVANRMYDVEDSFMRAWFFSLGNVYCARLLKNENIVVDRHLVSNYYWNGDDVSDEVFRCIVNYCGKPDLTILLYATSQNRMERLSNRNKDDPDLLDPEKKDDGYNKMMDFLNRFDLPYVVIDTNNKDLEEVKNEIDIIMKEIKNENILIKKYEN